MGCLIALGSVAVVVGLFYIVWYIWGMTGFWILAGLIVLFFVIILFAQGGSDIEDGYYDD